MRDTQVNTTNILASKLNMNTINNYTTTTTTGSLTATTTGVIGNTLHLQDDNEVIGCSSEFIKGEKKER